MKFKFYLMALLVSVSMVFVACNKDEDAVEGIDGAFAAEIVGTYEGTMIFDVAGIPNNSRVEILVEKYSDNSVTISYVELDDEEGEADAPKRFIDGKNGDEEDDLISKFENVVVKKQGDAYVFVTKQDEQTSEEFGKMSYTLNGGVTNKIIVLDVDVKVSKPTAMTVKIKLTGTLQETK